MKENVSIDIPISATGGKEARGLARVITNENNPSSAELEIDIYDPETKCIYSAVLTRQVIKSIFKFYEDDTNNETL